MLKPSKSFADRLKTLRGSASQSAFAETLGIKQTTYSAYERGRMEPSASIIVLIAKNTNVSADWLLGITEEEGGDSRVKKANLKLDALKKAISELLKEY